MIIFKVGIKCGWFGCSEIADNVYCNNIYRFKLIKKYFFFLGGWGVGYYLRLVDV